MTKIYKRYTEEEDNLIFQTIQANPDNIMCRCRELAVTLNRNPLSIHSRWYKLTKKDSNNSKDKTKYALVGKTIYNPNRKVVKENTQQSIELPRSKWRRILDILFE